MKKIAVILSGCGFQDGSEITEAVSSLICLSKLGAQYKVFAPSLDVQAKDHLSGEDQEIRNTLKESARIARGAISDISSLKSQDFHGILFPGGYGAALHLCDWGLKGSQCYVHPEAQRVITEFSNQGLPIGAICIAPALIAKVLGHKGVTVTIGNDTETAMEIEKTGSHHEACQVTDYVTDRENKIVTTPAYMYGEAAPHEVFSGIHGATKELFEMS